MASDEEKPTEGKGFTVQDRRRFSAETGAARQDAPEQTAAGTQPTSATAQAAEAARASQEEALPEINFSAFVISLSTQVLMNLGEIASPITGQVETDVPVAKQMIDILAMLKDKTRGNLNASEDRLIEDILFDLRMKYVEAVKKR